MSVAVETSLSSSLLCTNMDTPVFDRETVQNDILDNDEQQIMDPDYMDAVVDKEIHLLQIECKLKDQPNDEQLYDEWMNVLERTPISTTYEPYSDASSDYSSIPSDADEHEFHEQDVDETDEEYDSYEEIEI